MCGIAVTIELAPNIGVKPSAYDLTLEMLQRLRHRGPDDLTIQKIPNSEHQTVLVGPMVVLGHTRLNIVGGEVARHPFMWSNGQKRMALIHNGEIYNHRELKELLILQGDCQAKDFKTECDSEVLLACCSRRGIEWTLSNIKGMFSFVLVESLQKSNAIEVVERVIVARDTFGIKPLCYAIDKKRLIIASEVSAIPHCCGLDEHNLKIEDVLPATYIEFIFQKDNNITTPWPFRLITRPYDTGCFGPQPLRSMEDIEDGRKEASFPSCRSLNLLRKKLIDAVHLRLPNPENCRAAVLLSGGLDSSLIASIAAARLLGQRNLCTFNIRYNDESNEASLDRDYHYARKVVKHITNLEHEELAFSFDDGKAVLPEVIRCLETYDTVCIRAGVPLYLLSKHIASLGFKIILCGEGADESMAGYRLFEDFIPSSPTERRAFQKELNRRLMNIDTSELQRVDRCTSAHGLEARVPFLDLDFVQEIMNFCPSEKMTHSSLGRIQKYIIRRAFDAEDTGNLINDESSWLPLPDSILYREKEQFADGIGRGWIKDLQEYAINKLGITDGESAEKALYKNIFLEDKEKSCYLRHGVRESLVQARQARRKNTQAPYKSIGTQYVRLFSASTDSDLQGLNISKEDSRLFLQSVLGWTLQKFIDFKPTLSSLNRLIVSMLQKVPFHNFTLLVRERRPPTLNEIKQDMMSGLGGPCSVVNTFFAALLITLGFGPNIYLLSCHILGQENCHVAILVQIKGLRYFVDVANAKPYLEAVHLGDTSTKTSLNGLFEWRLSYNNKSSLMELRHFDSVALSFDPSSTNHFSSFRKMIEQSRMNRSFGPFLTGLRFCLYPSSGNVLSIMAVRDAYIYEGKSTKNRRNATNRSDIELFAQNRAFSHIEGFSSMAKSAIRVLDDENPEWFDNAIKQTKEKTLT